MTTAAWVLIVWAVAVDGHPTLPIEITPGLTFATCSKLAKLEQKKPGTHAICRPLVLVKV